ncbi:MAG: glutamyl-tRNA amidotransferase [SAR86 cluster bacterium]|uniref:Glutamyl-tRNA amidotransferase n=1 Tax=SAR86 cluster bacterium TaxID=2030880 RepID=A0A2A5CCX7_9GAMM|nr:GatB/YqeY domain-containing protein [bacterium AH-315-I11]MBN4074998.1 GatB/YqeY domain-containing protein [Gammaproteobacteria bacterium AH-315-E17]PCJ41744.1 MAG: glutamyl-tRNA amidotransferase [SAR86 cluster bacterium]
MTEQTIKPRISDAMKDAMRAKDKPRLSAIRLMLAELKKIEVDERIELEDDRILGILDKMLKQRRDSIKQYTAGNRQDLADVEQAEINVILEFMPAALTDVEITTIVEDAILESGAASMKEMGAVMNIVRPKVMGRADMGQVSGLVKSKLS